MAELSQRPIVVKSGDKIGEGQLQLHTLSDRQRTMRAVTIWVVMWILAVMSLPLMIIHFVLVPSFLIAGPLLGMRRYRKTEILESASGNCPSCKQEFTVSAETFGRLPTWLRCKGCGAAVQLFEKEGVRQGSGRQ